MPKKTSVLVISNGPVPDHKQSVVEGGGLRVWSLAQGLRSQGFEVSIAIPQEYFKAGKNESIPFSSPENLVRLASRFDVLVANYAGPHIDEVFDKVPKKILRIADAYVPIHVEISARDGSGVQHNPEEFFIQHRNWTKTLSAADALLITSDAQSNYYTGLLFGMGIMNSANYRHLKLIKTPFGVNPEAHLSDGIIEKNQPKLMWWGGFYPWFDFNKFVEICKEVSKISPAVGMEVVGPINPFIKEASFLSPATKAVKALQKLPNTIITEWVDYSKRLELIKSADLVISLNVEGPENSTSWRTRYLDLIQAGVPLATNGGDPLGELILDTGAGVELTGDARQMANQIVNALSGGLNFQTVGLEKLSAELSWDKNVLELTAFINSENHYKAQRSSFGLVPQDRRFLQSSQLRSQNSNVFAMAVDHYKKWGFLSTCKKIVEQSSLILSSKKFANRQAECTTLLFHQLDLSGAPLVGTEIAREFIGQGQKVQIVTPLIKDRQLAGQLENAGIGIKKMSAYRNVKFHKDSRVIINSAATPRRWIKNCLDSFLDGSLQNLSLFVHENEPSLFLDHEISELLLRASDAGMQIFVPSRQAQAKMRSLHGLKIKATIQRYSISQAPMVDMAKKTSTLELVLVGPTGDNRKRQLDTIIGVAYAQQQLADKSQYRRINLNLVGVGDDPIGNEVKRLCHGLLAQGSFRIYPPLSHEKCLEVVANSNVAVSLSDNESFGIYLAEAMSSGSVVLRTPVGGHHETVVDGKNGFLVKKGVYDFSRRLVQIADRKTTTDETLRSYLDYSKILITPHVHSGYKSFVDQISNKGATKNLPKKSVA